ncbi:MAG: hypothetical protein ACXAEU_23895 [Candidatus Hodarchaeales archaeon]|jgi:hypothetical protein
MGKFVKWNPLSDTYEEKTMINRPSVEVVEEYRESIEILKKIMAKEEEEKPRKSTDFYSISPIFRMKG